MDHIYLQLRFHGSVLPGMHFLYFAKRLPHLSRKWLLGDVQKFCIANNFVSIDGTANICADMDSPGLVPAVYYVAVCHGTTLVTFPTR